MSTSTDQICVTGIAGVFPKSENVSELYENLSQKRQLFTSVDSAWKYAHENITPLVGRIPQRTKFDAGFFGIHYKRAEGMSVSCRKLLELSIEAIMDAGLNPTDLKNTKTGVFVTSESMDIMGEWLWHELQSPNFGVDGLKMAEQISYYLQLQGPSVIVDSACSSSLYALHLATTAIKTGRCDNVLLCGGSTIQNPHIHYGFQQLGTLDLNGHGNVFSNLCTGYIRSEGVMVMLIQKHKNSKRFYAEILNVKTISDGFKSTPITYPSSTMTANNINETYGEIGMNPATVEFVESHVTGTTVGITQEIKTLKKSFTLNRKQPLFIGSVKANLGHCESASGLISLFKILVGLQYNCILPIPDYGKLDKNVEALMGKDILIATESIPLPIERDVIIGCNNIGIGGTSGHAILKHRAVPFCEYQNDSNRLLCFSARTMSSLTKIINSVKENSSDSYLSLLQDVFRCNISNHHYRGFVILNKGEILEHSLEYCTDKRHLRIVYSNPSEECANLIKLANEMPIVTQKLEKIRRILLTYDIDVYSYFNESTHNFQDLVLMTIVLQLALTDVLKDLVQDKIERFEGFSSGLIATAYAKNALSLEDALMIALSLRNRIKENQAQQLFKHLEHIATEFNLATLCKSSEEKQKASKTFVKLTVGSAKTKGHLSFNSNLSFLTALGRLYTMGHSLNLDILYKNRTGPVKAPFISPLIEWQHEDDWNVVEYRPISLHRHVVTIDLKDPSWSFLSGHVIDGRNLFPATAYIFLVWHLYAEVNRFFRNKVNIIFEDVRFHRATIITKEKPLILTVELAKLQNKFEVIESDECVVSGKVYNFSKDIDIPNLIKNCSQETMKTDDIYKKLKLHGYNYSDDFCCLQRASVDGSMSYVKYNNWTTFLDAMQQLTLLTIPLDHLYVPVKLDQLIIDPQMNSQALTKHNKIVAIHFDQKSNTIVGPGVIMRNPIMSTIKKRTNMQPSLAVHKFVPFNADLSLSDSVMVHVQIVTENIGNVLKVTEVVDSFTKTNNKLLCPLIHNALQSHVCIDSNLFIYSSNTYNYPNVVVERKTIGQIPPDSNLVILSDASRRPTIVRKILQNSNTFVLSRESLHFYPFLEAETVSVHRAGSESFVLLRKCSDNDRSVVRITSDFAWLTQLQLELNANKKVLLVAYDDNKSGILGFVNCLKEEVGQSVSCVFVPKADRDFHLNDEFYRNQLKKNLLFNVYKDGSWGSYRHLPLNEMKRDCSHAVCVTVPGSLSNVEYIQGSLTKESSRLEHTLIDVYYSGLNFKDIVIATGRIHLNESKQYRSKYESVGLEFSGKTSSGQKVFGITKRNTFSNLVMANYGLVWKVPLEWSMEDAATVPITYVTVLYSLFKVYRLKVGQSILIHSGTGGIGQTAINIALHYKCNIFTTVGSSEKRKYLRKLYPTIPDSHIGNSRDSTFEAMILKQTKGKGVDVVLNSLTEEKLLVNTRCLARNGIVLELGKYDGLLNSPLPVETFAIGRSYAAISTDRFFDSIPSMQKDIASLIDRGLKEGYVKPLPRVIYAAEKVEDAFRFMSSGKHTGKILLKFKDDSSSSDISIKANPRFHCDPEKVYLIIGGLGGIGLELADWLIGRAARKLMLVSRRGVTTGYQSHKLYLWNKLGCCVSVVKHDLATEEGYTTVLTEANALGVVDGIFNLSAVLHDAMIENQTVDSFKTVFGSKSVITDYMDKASRRLCPQIRQFVVFSSVLSGVGSSGQTNYGMANSIAERICELRQKEGYPGLAIQWGPIGDVGLVAEKDVTISNFSRFVKQKLSSCLEVLDTLLTQEHPVVSSSVLDIKSLEKGLSKSEDFLSSIQSILALPNLQYVSMHSPLSTIGLDSTFVVQLQQFLRTKYNIVLSPKELQISTLDTLMKKHDEISTTFVD